MENITITLSLDDWMTIKKTLSRGLEGYSEDLQFLIKATTVMNLKKEETEIVMSRARAVTFMKRKCVHLASKDPDDEVMKNNVATFTELQNLIDSYLDDDKYGWNFVTQQGEEGE